MSVWKQRNAALVRMVLEQGRKVNASEKEVLDPRAHVGDAKTFASSPAE